MSAELKSLILCDFAQIREGLLFVQSGGLTTAGGADLSSEVRLSRRHAGLVAAE